MDGFWLPWEGSYTYPTCSPTETFSESSIPILDPLLDDLLPATSQSLLHQYQNDQFLPGLDANCVPFNYDLSLNNSPNFLPIHQDEAVQFHQPLQEPHLTYGQIALHPILGVASVARCVTEDDYLPSAPEG